MKNAIAMIFKYLSVFLLIYPVGVILAILLMVLYISRFVRIKNWERIDNINGKTIIVSNHPSMLDPFLAASLLYRKYLRHPLKYGPRLVSDRKNFYDSWYFFWLRLHMIPVDRENRNSDRSLLKAKKALDKGRIIIIFPEGGRTFRRKEFLYSQKGKRIGVLKEGIGLLVSRTGARVLPVWIDGSEKVLPNSHKRLFNFWNIKSATITVKVGKPLDLQGKNLAKEEITQMVVNSLLQLADEE